MKRRDFLGVAAAFAAAGCATAEPKKPAAKVDAVTRATPVVPWRPKKGKKKIRVVQWGMRHEHADGKFMSLKKLPEDFELVGIIDDRAEEMCKAERLHREGKLPKRVCHCDTKVNNMMFDEQGNVLCVIDLDTVMPSFIFSDFGDFLRSAANTGLEDDPELSNVTFNMEIFKAFAKGYLESAKSFLLPIEIENLPYAAALFPYMQCVRFLTDYINGDTYYKIKYPEHNLVRTKAQFKLLQSVEEHTPDMKAFIASCL